MTFLLDGAGGWQPSPEYTRKPAGFTTSASGRRFGSPSPLSRLGHRVKARIAPLSGLPDRVRDSKTPLQERNWPCQRHLAPSLDVVASVHQQRQEVNL